MTVENNNDKKPVSHAKPFNHKKLVIIISIILAVVLLLVSVFFIILKIGENRLRNEAQVEDSIADVYYNGEAYNYNKKLINILVMGIDQRENNKNKHQADALYLLSLDNENNSLKAIAISRNTIAEMDTYDINGKFFSTAKQQICLAYTYGKTAELSSENTVKAVSNLLYNIPISGYYSIYMGAVKDIVDAVGGVPVHITEDLTYVDKKMKPGADVTVTGENALKFLQYRPESNAQRHERQKRFVASFMNRAKEATLKDLSLPAKMYKKLAANTVTNINAASAVYLASEAINADFELLGIEGTNGHDGAYETFVPDDEKLYTLLLDVFYKKQK